jgi:hypothetical protein
MAAGDLSSDQSAYVDRVASGTGLARPVVVAWVGAESGWGITKAGHNYLNVGPGETYPDVTRAAARVVGLINGNNLYAGIRAAIPAGPGAQIQAIGASPWGTSATVLAQVYSHLSGTTVTAAAAAGSTGDIQTVSLIGDVASAAAAGVGTVVAGPIGGLLGLFGGQLTKGVKDLTGIDIVGGLVTAGLTIVFTVAAFAFIAMGVNRLTGGGVKDIFDTVNGAVGGVAGAAKLAAL